MRVAVVGTGSAGTRHLRVLRMVEGVEPIAVPLRTSRRTRLSADGFLTAPDLPTAVSYGASCAIVATDTGRHADDGMAALNHGLDVLIEKPLARTAKEAHIVLDAASTRGRGVFVGCALRFSDSLNRFRSVLPEAGRLHAVEIECRSSLPDWRPHRAYHHSYSARAEEGGVLRDLIHEIDYAGWLFGWPTALQARVRNLGRLGIAAEEIAELTWESPAGGMVSMSLDYLTRPARRRMRACGERGTLEWDGIAGTVTLAIGTAPVKEFTFTSAQTWDELLIAQARAFINTSRGIPDGRLATGEEGVKALAVCDAARRASDTRREEPVEYP